MKISIFMIFNLILILLSAYFLYRNRKFDNQQVDRALFAVIICIFLVLLILDL